ncbi:MAG: hypothetical protein ACI92Z_002911 [Paracoccaceae bacterium]|jgi:hypothetical protein
MFAGVSQHFVCGDTFGAVIAFNNQIASVIADGCRCLKRLKHHAVASQF